MSEIRFKVINRVITRHIGYFNVLVRKVSQQYREIIGNLTSSKTQKHFLIKYCKYKNLLMYG